MNFQKTFVSFFNHAVHINTFNLVYDTYVKVQVKVRVKIKVKVKVRVKF